MFDEIIVPIPAEEEEGREGYESPIGIRVDSDEETSTGPLHQLINDEENS